MPETTALDTLLVELATALARVARTMGLPGTAADVEHALADYQDREE